MKKVVAILMLVGLVAGLMSAPAGAAKKKKKPTVRTLEVAYSNSVAIGGLGGTCPAGNCPAIPTGANEYFAMFFIEDDFSPSGYISLAYDPDGDGIDNLGAGPTVCGSTPEPVAVEPGISYTAWPFIAGTECPGSSSFSGTITALFSSDPEALKAAAAKL